MNLAIPDTASTYFTMFYALSRGETQVVRGEYPDARFLIQLQT